MNRQIKIEIEIPGSPSKFSFEYFLCIRFFCIPLFIVYSSVYSSVFISSVFLCLFVFPGKQPSSPKKKCLQGYINPRKKQT